MKKIIVTILLLLTIISCYIPSVGVLADSSTDTFYYDSSDIYQDLDGLVIGDKKFDKSNYTYDTTKNTELIFLYEIGYRKYSLPLLYVYVYNPQLINYNLDSSANKIQIATQYCDGLPCPTEYDSNGVKNDYSKFDLEFVSQTSDKLFLKYKVLDFSSLYRSYYVSGIELLVDGNNSATEYVVAKNFVYSGYMKGCGDSKNDPLSCKIEDIAVLSLEVHDTFYRTESSSKGKGYQNQLNSVYFSIPNEFLERYGQVQGIKAEWYEYKTKDIIVTSNKDFYNDFLEQDMAGKVLYDKVIGDYDYSGDIEVGDFDWGLGSFYDKRLDDHFLVKSWDFYYDWIYNLYSGQKLEQDGSWIFNDGYIRHVDTGKDSPCYSLSYIFDTQGKDLSEYIVSSERLDSYIRNYKKGNFFKASGSDYLSEDLFQSKVDTGRIRGYNCIDFNAETDINLPSYGDSNGFWDITFDYGLGSALFGDIGLGELLFGGYPNEDSVEINDTIYKVKESDLSLSSITNSLYINESNLNDFKEFCNSSFKNNSSPYIFRFAVTDYFSEYLDLFKNGYKKGESAYRAQTSVFLDFDIIQLTFDNGETSTIMPVVSSPIDIVPDITPPPKYETDWQQIIIIIVLVCVLILFVYYLFK